MAHRYLQLPFDANAFGAHRGDGRLTHIVVSNGKVSTEVDLQTGSSSAAPGSTVRERVDPSIGLGGLGERLVETREGPRTELFAPGAPQDPLAAFAGELVSALRADPAVLCIVQLPGHRYDLVVATRASQVRLPASFRAVLKAGEGHAVAAGNGLAHLVRLDGPRVVTVAASAATFEARQAHLAGPHDVRIAGGEVLLLSARTLLIVDLAAIPFDATHRAIALTFEPITGRAAGLSEPAVVTMLLGSKIIADHPQVRRLTIDRRPDDPPIAVGEKIRIDDLREPLPGILKVEAWSKLTGAASVRPGPPPLVLAAPAVAPITDLPAGGPAVRQHNAEVLARVAERWSFAPPEALVRFLQATDEDAVLRRWMERLGMATIEVRDLSLDWSADPCLLAFAGVGNGDEYSLYLYPPALARGEVPVALYLHEENASEFLASGFESFIARFLADRADQQPDLVGLVHRRLGMEPSAGEAESAPEWFLEERTRPPEWAGVEALETGGELLLAERGYLAHYLASGGAPARDALARTYAKLGWTAALATLRRASEHV